MSTYTIIGGYSYAGGIDIECGSMSDAAAAWFDRWSSNGRRYIDGVLYPCFGDMEEDDYAVVNFDTDETLTRAEVLAMFHSDR